MASRIAALRETLQREIAAIEERTEPLHKEMQKLQDEIRPKEDRIRELHQKIKEVEHGEPSLRDLRQDLAGLDRAAGAKVLKAETANVAAQPQDS